MFSVTCNISNDNGDQNRRINEAAELMEHGNIQPLPQTSRTIENPVDSSSSRPSYGNNIGQLAISSPYTLLSECYAGKVSNFEFIRKN